MFSVLLLNFTLMFQMPIKKLYMLIEMAVQGAEGGSSEAIYSGREKIDINHFFDCLGDIISVR